MGQSRISVSSAHGVSLGEAFRVWLKIGLLGFGGPAGQIALMHRILVEEKGWIGEGRFLHALNYCMLLPGPEATQLATYVGWLLHRTLGGVMAGVLFVLPGALVILVLSILYAGFQDVQLVQGLFFGIKAAVLAVVVEALIKIGKRALKGRSLYGIAGLAFVGIYFLGLPFPLIIAAAFVAGLIMHRTNPDAFPDLQTAGGDARLDILLDGEAPPHTRPSVPRAIRVTVVCLLLWFGPIAGLAWHFGTDSVFVDEGLFFSKMAVVTFGGAYAVLAYVAQQAVEGYGWLNPGEMLDGLGMAETTPGPLIMVLQFVGFMGAFRNPADLDPMMAGVLGAAVTTWVTFVPCFLWIFLGAPYMEALRGSRGLQAGMTAITAAVVGVILNLAVWFAVRVIFTEVDEMGLLGLRLFVPVWASADLVSLALSVAAFAALMVYKRGMIEVLAVAAALGAAWFLLTV